MPMCQSQKIVEVWLRVNTAAVNDNVPATGKKSIVQKSGFTAMWSALPLAGYQAVAQHIFRYWRAGVVRGTEHTK